MSFSVSILRETVSKALLESRQTILTAFSLFYTVVGNLPCFLKTRTEIYAYPLCREKKMRNSFCLCTWYMFDSRY